MCPTCLSLEDQDKEEDRKTVVYSLLVSEQGTFSKNLPNNLKHIETTSLPLEIISILTQNWIKKTESFYGPISS